MEPNFVADVRERITFSDEKMQKVSLFDTPRCMVDLYCARPGQGQRPHTHAGEDKTYHVLQGQGEFQVGDERRTLGPGGMAHAPAGAVHGLTNPGPDDLVVLVVIAPPVPH